MGQPKARDAEFYRRLYRADPAQRQRRLDYQAAYHKLPEQLARRARNMREARRRARFRLYARDGFACVYCLEPFDVRELSIDHKQPVSRGGTDEESNLVAACRRCNRAKGTMTYDEFMLILDPHHVPSWVTEGEAGLVAVSGGSENAR